MTELLPTLRRFLGLTSYEVATFLEMVDQFPALFVDPSEVRSVLAELAAVKPINEPVPVPMSSPVFVTHAGCRVCGVDVGDQDYCEACLKEAETACADCGVQPGEDHFERCSVAYPADTQRKWTETSEPPPVVGAEYPLTIVDVMSVLCCSQRTVYRLAEKDELHPVKIGTSLRFSQEDVDAYRARCSTASMDISAKAREVAQMDPTEGGELPPGWTTFACMSRRCGKDFAYPSNPSKMPSKCYAHLSSGGRTLRIQMFENALKAADLARRSHCLTLRKG